MRTQFTSTQIPELSSLDVVQRVCNARDEARTITINRCRCNVLQAGSNINEWIGLEYAPQTGHFIADPIPFILLLIPKVYLLR